MKLSARVKSTLITLIVCVISGLTSGYIFMNIGGSSSGAYVCPPICSNDFNVSELVLSLSPGIIFGLLFSITSISVNAQVRYFGFFHAIISISAYTIISAAVWLVARLIAFFLFVSDNYALAFLIAGLFGGGVLAFATHKFWAAAVKSNRWVEIGIAVVGAIGGLAFFLELNGKPTSLSINWIWLFVIWQSAVGSALSLSINKDQPVGSAITAAQFYEGETGQEGGKILRYAKSDGVLIGRRGK